MSNYSIALSGLSATQKALDIIGNNIANAATEGYHRQQVNLTPAYTSQQGTTFIGGGVNADNVARMIDTLLEIELDRQKSVLSQTSQECATLQTVENIFGEFLSDDTGLSAAINNFFNDLQNLAAYPAEPIWQNQAVNSAEILVQQFRTIGTFLEDLDAQIKLEIDSAVESLNVLSQQTADLNDNIQRIEVAGSKANSLSDTRDNCITKIAELIGIQKQQGQYGSASVSTGSMPIVLNSSYTNLKTGYDVDGLYGLAMTGSDRYTASFDGGKIAGLLNLKNTILPQISDDIDLLAKTIIQKINDLHVQGCGVSGSFTQLSGAAMSSSTGTLTTVAPTVADGDFYIRLTNTATGQITRHKITVDASDDTLTTIAVQISAVTGLSSSVINSKLTIQADNGYKFDFMPAPLPQGEDVDFNGTTTPTVSVSGIYDGQANDIFTFTVVGTGEVGNGTLSLVVKNESAQTVANLNIGDGYAAGDKLEVANGIYIALSTGDLVADDSFKVTAFADTDSSGLLAAAGMNTFFSGSSAGNMAVNADIIAKPGTIAVALGADFADNTNADRMAALRDTQLTELSDLSFGQFYNKTVTDLGQDISTKQAKQENLELMVQNLTNRRTDISGVDINEEAAQLLVFEQMYQAMAKYLNTIQTSLETLMNVM